MTPELLAEIKKSLADPFTSPPEEYKRSQIVEYGKKYNCDLLIETGTNRGDTLDAVKNYFADSYSIELGPELYRAAKERFIANSHVHLMLGDAGDVLFGLLPNIAISRKILFYLDAHSRYDETSPE